MIWLKILWIVCRTLLGIKRPLTFKGLSNAEHFASKAELKEYVKAFLNEYGHKLKRKRKIVIKFLGRRNIMKPGKLGDAHLKKGKDYIRIYMPLNKTREEFFDTFFHELDHAMWMRENGQYFYANAPYEEREHEIRARKRAEIWVNKVLNT